MPSWFSRSFFVLYAATRPVAFSLGGLTLYYPYPDIFHSFSADAFVILKDHILPRGMELLNVNAFDVLISSFYIAAVLAAVTSSPVWAYEVVAFVSPGLKPDERRTLTYSIVPATLLFGLGAAFAYFVLLPFLFKFVYLFTVSFGVAPTLSLRSFINTVFFIMLAMGLSFQTPLIMGALSYVGIVSYSQWKSWWRYGIAVSFFVALLISPGATGGILEATIGFVLSALYFCGLLVSRLVTKQEKGHK